MLNQKKINDIVQDLINKDFTQALIPMLYDDNSGCIFVITEDGYKVVNSKEVNEALSGEDGMEFKQF